MVWRKELCVDPAQALKAPPRCQSWEPPLLLTCSAWGSRAASWTWTWTRPHAQNPGPLWPGYPGTSLGPPGTGFPVRKGRTGRPSRQLLGVELKMTSPCEPPWA